MVGARTQIQRLLGGNIPDGKTTVVVKYNYQIGGTFAYNQFRHSLQMNWLLNKYASVFMGYYQSRQDLKEGVSTVPLNDVTSKTFGARTSRRFYDLVTVGGSVSFEEREEDLNPSDRTSYDAYLEFPFYGATNIRLSGHRARVDNKHSVEDVDNKGVIARLQSNLWGNTILSLESSYQVDTGGTIDRLNRNHKIQLQWRRRRLRFLLDADYSDEEQAALKRERWSTNAILRRDF